MQLLKKCSVSFRQSSLSQKIRILFLIIAVFLTVATAVEMIIVYVTNENTFYNTVFYAYEFNIFSDFFDVNEFVYGGNNPYTSSFASSYPPLPLVIAKFFSLFGDYSQGADAVSCSAAGLVTYLCAFGVSLFFSIWALIRLTKKYKLAGRTGIACAVLVFFSAAYVYAFVRGNYIFVAMPFFCWFFVWYDSEKRWQREVAVAFLAIAAAIKIYPALFAVIYLKNRKWLAFLQACVYTALLFVLPFVCFEGGFSNIKVFLNNLNVFQSNRDVADHNYSIPTFLFYFVAIAQGGKPLAVPEWLIQAGDTLAPVFLILGMLCALFSKETWKCFMAAGVATVLYPSPSYVYSAFVFLPAIVLFLCTENKTKKDFIYLGAMVLLCDPFELGWIVSPAYFPFGLNITCALQNLAIYILFALLLYDCVKGRICDIRHLLAQRKQKRDIQNTVPAERGKE